MSSAPYFPCVPLSTSKKYACRLFNTANFDLLTSNWANTDKVCGWKGEGKIRKKNVIRMILINGSAEEPVNGKVNSQTANALVVRCFFLFPLRVFTNNPTENDTTWIFYLGDDILWQGTSRLCPNSSWFRSTIPHGAIPMLTTRPVRCCPSSSNASPTCFVTPENWIFSRKKQRKASQQQQIESIGSIQPTMLSNRTFSYFCAAVAAAVVVMLLFH